MACLYKVVKAMKYVYESYEIDQFIGGVTEYPAVLGSTFANIFANQFTNLRWTDRYFYNVNQPIGFSSGEIK